jgi:hypothetical protein
MQKLLLKISALTFLFCSSLVSGSSSPKNAVLALGPWETASPMLIGVFSDQKWFQDQEAAKLVKGGETVKLFSHAGLSGTAKAGSPESLGAPCEETFGVGLTPNQKTKAFQIGMTATWNPRPRALAVLPNNSVPYQKIAKTFLETKGLKNPVVVLTNVLKTDIDNDRSDEVFIVGRHFQEGAKDQFFPPVNGKKGDYSFALMRKIVNGKVQTISLGDDVILKDMKADAVPIEGHLARFYDIAGVLDLNGDGKLELVIYDAYYEGEGFEILEWNSKKFVSLSYAGCGA